MALIMFDGENHSTSDAWVVAVYEMNRHYGGPEEGGWYYDTRELVAMATAESEEAATLLAMQLEEGDYKSTGDRFSVVYPGYGDFQMWIHEPGKKIIHKDPIESPRYE